VTTATPPDTVSPHIAIPTNRLPVPGTNRTYTLVCSDAYTQTAERTITLTVRNYPNLTPTFTQPTVGTFNTTTNRYNTLTIDNVTVTNSGESPAAPNTLRVTLDFGADGTIDRTENRSIATLAAMATSPNQSLTFTDIPYGDLRVTAVADVTSAVTETVETDNTRTVTYSLLPPAINPPPGDPNPPINPPPGTAISVQTDDEFVRRGERTTVRWNTTVTYPMTCTVTGPGITVPPFDPSISGPTGSVMSAPVTNKQIFTIRCVEPITGGSATDTADVETTGSVEEI
jgi:hypothetical protein